MVMTSHFTNSNDRMHDGTRMRIAWNIFDEGLIDFDHVEWDAL